MASKFRVGEEPEPFVYEVRLPKDAPWTLHEVTAALVGEGEAAAATAAQERSDRLHAAARALEPEIRARAATSDGPMDMAEAVAFLKEAFDLTRKPARDLIAQGAGSRWRIEALMDRQGRPKVLLPLVPKGEDSNGAGEITTTHESPALTRVREGDVSATRMNGDREKPVAQTTPSVDAIRADGLFLPAESTPEAQPPVAVVAEAETAPEDMEVI